MREKRNRPFWIFTLCTIGLTVIALLLAYRYLIHRVEISDVAAYAESFSQTATETLFTDATSSVIESSIVTEVVSTAAATEVKEILDDWNYISEGVSISIQEVSIGSGSSKVTYFVADVVIDDATTLQSAFADNQFGRNIIEYTSTIAQENNAIFAINGDYYGFREDGIIIRNGVIYRDIPARTGLAFYLDGTMKIYDETTTSAQELLNAGVWNTLSFGPALLENGEIVTNMERVEIDTNIGNHSIQGDQPRTGIGIISANHFVFVVVDGRSKGYSRGLNLVEYAQVFKDMGCTEAYNLDGGGSSVMYFNGRLVNNPLGRNKERGTSDILFIGS